MVSPTQPFAAAPEQGTRLWILGQPLEIRIGSEQTGGAYAMTEATAEPGWSGAPPHIHHSEDEAVFVIEGELEFIVNGLEITASTGTVVHIPRGALHSFRNAKSTSSRLLTVYTPGGFERWFLEVGEPINAPERLGPAQSASLELLVERGTAHGLEIPGIAG